MATKTKAKKDDVEHRKILVACKFNKPSAILPTGDEGEDAIKMNVVIPHSEIARSTVAEEFFGEKRLMIHFSLRGTDKWKSLPGVDDHEEIIECESEVSGYKRTKQGYSIAFKVSCDLIDDNTAMRQYAKHVGSCRLTLLGDIEPPRKSKAEEPTAAMVAKARPLQGQKKLELETADSN